MYAASVEKKLKMIKCKASNCNRLVDELEDLKNTIFVKEVKNESSKVDS